MKFSRCVAFQRMLRGEMETGTPKATSFKAALIVSTLLFAGYLVVVCTSDGRSPPQLLAANGLLMTAKLYAVAMCFFAARRRGATARVWWLLGLGYLTSAIGLAVWAVLQFVLRVRVPYPSWADFFFLLIIPLSAAALALWPAESGRWTTRVRRLFDGALIASSILFICWATFLASLYARFGPSPLERAVGLAYPTGFVCVASLLVFAVSRAPSLILSPPFRLLSLSVMSFTIVNVLYTALTLERRYYTGHPIDLLWMVAFISGALAAAMPPPKIIGSLAPKVTRGLQVILPNVPFLGVLTVAWWVYREAPHRLDSFLFWNGMFVAGCLAARQLLALIDVHDLTEGLEEKIHIRTEELRRNQTALLHAERLQAMATLTAGIAHDMRNLVTTMNLSVAAIERSQHPLHTSQTQPFASLRDAVRRSIDLLNKLKRAGRADTAMHVNVDLSAVLRELAPLLYETVGNDVTLNLTLRDATLEVRGNASELSQVVLNLVQNARDATSAGGCIDVKAWLEPSYSGVPALVMLEVRDSGCGIPEAIRDRVFEPLVTSKSVGEGTGLGLALVWNLVKSMEGHVDFTSTVGSGTVFTVRLPHTPPTTKSVT